MIYLGLLLFISFGLIILRGAPFVASKKESIEDAFDVLQLKPGEKMADLGCGNGSVLKYFSNRGIEVVGYELNPILYLYCRLRFINNSKVKIYWGDYLRANLEVFDAVYVFTMDQYANRLAAKLLMFPNLKVVSVGFRLPRLKLLKSTKRIHLYATK